MIESIFLLLCFLILPSYQSDVPPPHEGIFPVTQLYTNATLPLVGLGGCSGIRKSDVLSALSQGYQHIDTAQAFSWGYREDEVGEALSSSPVSRSSVFLQSKIHPEDLGYLPTKNAVLVSLERLGVDRLDSILLHKPRCWEGACQKQPIGTWRESWDALEEALEEGLVDAIGMCDVDEELLEALLQRRTRPHVVQ